MADVYLDALHLLARGTTEWRAVVETQLRRLPDATFATSRLSRLECRARPLRDGNHALAAQYDAVFAPDSVRLVEVDGEVIERATELRARYNVKAPDAIHLASAIHIGASAFVTADAALQRCVEAHVVLLTA